MSTLLKQNLKKRIEYELTLSPILEDEEFILPIQSQFDNEIVELICSFLYIQKSVYINLDKFVKNSTKRYLRYVHLNLDDRNLPKLITEYFKYTDNFYRLNMIEKIDIYLLNKLNPSEEIVSKIEYENFLPFFQMMM